MRSRSVAGTRRKSFLAGLAITKFHVMPPLIKRGKFAPLEGASALVYCSRFVWLRCFLDVAQQPFGREVLHNIRHFS
jgi:hypothetical protein